MAFDQLGAYLSASSDSGPFAFTQYHSEHRETTEREVLGLLESVRKNRARIAKMPERYDVVVNRPIEAPGGLCMTFGCDFDANTGCSGEDSVCAPAGDSGFGICFQTCTLGGGECREAEGYKCFPAGFFGVCAHAGVGDACTACEPDPQDVASLPDAAVHRAFREL